MRLYRNEKQRIIGDTRCTDPVGEKLKKEMFACNEATETTVMKLVNVVSHTRDIENSCDVNRFV